MNSGLPIGEMGKLFSLIFSVSVILIISLLASGGDYFINKLISF